MLERKVMKVSTLEYTSTLMLAAGARGVKIAKQGFRVMGLKG